MSRLLMMAALGFLTLQPLAEMASAEEEPEHGEATVVVTGVSEKPPLSGSAIGFTFVKISGTILDGSVQDFLLMYGDKYVLPGVGATCNINYSIWDAEGWIGCSGTVNVKDAKVIVYIKCNDGIEIYSKDSEPRLEPGAKSCLDEYNQIHQ